LIRISSIRPSHQTGFARSAGKSAYPGLWRGLVGAWVPALGPTGGTLVDVSGFGNHGDVTTTMDPATDWTIGNNPRVPGYALDFDGVDQEIDFGSSALLTSGLDVFTAIVWGRFPAGGTTEALIAWGAGPDIEIRNAADNAIIFMAGSNYRRFNHSPVNIDDNQWHHLAFVLPGTGAQSDIENSAMYADGLTQTINFTISTQARDTKGSLRLMAWNSSFFLPGSIGYFLIWNRALSIGEILTDFRNPLAPFILRQRVAVIAPPIFTGELHNPIFKVKPRGYGYLREVH